MGDKITLKVEERTAHGKKVAQLRRDGLTPGVVYGPGMDPLSIQVPDGEIRRTVLAAGKHTPVHLSGSKRRIAMIKDVEVDPVKDTVLHVSFHAVNAKDPVTIDVSIHLTGEGESEAEKAGLIILQTLDRVQIKALPMDLPEALELSTTGLVEDGERLTLADITLPQGVEYVVHTDGHQHNDDEEEQPSITDLVVASVWEPSALQAANENSGGDAEDESEVTSEQGTEEEAVNEDTDDKSEAKSE